MLLRSNSWRTPSGMEWLPTRPVEARREASFMTDQPVAEGLGTTRYVWISGTILTHLDGP